MLRPIAEPPSAERRAASRLPSCRPAVLLPLLTACGVRLEPIPMPVGLAHTAPAAAVRWADSTRPSESRDIRFRFQFENEDGAGGGDGRARYAFPDSVRIDFRGSLGIGRASGFVIGDSAIWTHPEKELRKVVRHYPLFWAMLGVARPPGAVSAVRGFADDRVTAWQFVADGDTVEYVRESGPRPRLIAEVRQAGRRVGRVETRFGPDGLPERSRLIVVRPAARLDLTFTQHAKVVPFAPDTWSPPAGRGP
ncbi:MAG: hypothetical protein ACT4PM_14460 [Gemmatimonadales bacterium]